MTEGSLTNKTLPYDFALRPGCFRTPWVIAFDARGHTSVAFAVSRGAVDDIYWSGGRRVGGIGRIGGLATVHG